MSDPNTDRLLTDGYLVGWFRWDLRTDEWEWSDGMYQIHRMNPGEITPTLEVLLAHKHPDDRPFIRATLDQAIVDGRPYSYRHRIIDMSGTEHTVITAGEGDLDGSGAVVALHGSLIDITSTVTDGAHELAGELYLRAVENRAAIEQVKGAFIAVYGLSDDEAFALLRWHSQRSNIKIHHLAARILDRIGQPDLADQPVRRKITIALTGISRQETVLPPRAEPASSAG